MELLIYIGKAAIILSIFYLVYSAVLRKDTLFTTNRHYLLTGILAAIIFPFIEITKTIIVERPRDNEIIYNELLPIEHMSIQETSSIDWWQIAFFIYILGVCFMLLRFIKQLLSLGLLIHKYPSVKKDGYRYIITSENTPPFSFFRTIVYNPNLHDQQELEMILKHEEVHASQWHSIDIMVTNLLLIFQWCNPLAWLYKKGVEENLEYIADSATAQQIESVKQYQLALVKASSTSPIPALTNNFYQSFIKKRIVMLNKRTSKKINAWKLIIVLPLLAVFLWSFNLNEVVTYSESNESFYEFTNPPSVSEGILVPSEKKSSNNSEENSANIIREVLSENEINPTTDEPTALAKEKQQMQFSEMIVQDVMITITKKTTKKELEAMKTNLKNNGVSFDYSNLAYNKSKEIIAISINYKSKDGNSGTYSVKSDTPINTIVIKTDGDRISIKSAGSNSSSYSSNESEAEMRSRTEEQQLRMEIHREEMENRREEMEIRMEEMKERQVDVEVRRVEAMKLLEERNVEILEEQREIHEKQKELNEHHNVFILKGDSSKVQRVRIFEDDEGGLFEIIDTDDASDGVIIIDRMGKNGNQHGERQRNANFSPDSRLITKNSSKNDLEKLKTEFDAKNISFSYSGVKRNDAGEITKIRLKIKDNKGSSSSSSYDGDGQAIDNILIDTNNGISIMKVGSH